MPLQVMSSYKYLGMLLHEASHLKCVSQGRTVLQCASRAIGSVISKSTTTVPFDVFVKLVELIV